MVYLLDFARYKPPETENRDEQVSWNYLKIFNHKNNIFAAKQFKRPNFIIIYD